MQRLSKLALSLAISIGAVFTASATETIVFMRHGEKPAAGLGQLNCQGLNRSLALPKVLQAKFGRPDLIVAPDPSEMNQENGSFNYVRPLATIEPTAIALGEPVRTPYGYTQIDQMNTYLTASNLKDSLIFVAWEHIELRELVKKILSSYGGNPNDVPPWPDSDYDTLYVVTLESSPKLAQLKIHHEHLDGQSTTCPN